MMRASKIVRNHGAKFFLLHLLVCAVMLVALPALQADSIPLAWNPSVDSYVAGYKIYYGTTSHVYTYSDDVGNVTNTTINGLSQNTTYYFAATSYDANGVESVFSNETNLLVYPTTAEIPIPNAYVNGQFAFAIPGITNVVSGVTNYLNYQYVVQASTNLVDWVPMQTNTAPFTFVDTNASQFSQRFYRAVNLPNPTN
jgi:Fibronectin type III domain